MGRYSSASAGGGLSFVHSPSTGMASIGRLPGEDARTGFNAVSDDGVAVGTVANGRTNVGAILNRAARWSAAGGLELLPLPDPLDEFQQSSALAVLNDGRVFGSSASGWWLYSDSTGFDVLPEEAWGLGRINSDGAVISGNDGEDDVYLLRAAYWTPDTGRQILEPYIDNGASYGVTGMNDDGSIIVGEQANVGFLIWLDQGSPVLFEDYVAGFGVDLMGHTIRDIRGVSADGTTFVGEARDPLGGNIAFSIVIPSPGVLPALCVAGGVLARRRR
ncbi:MAG: hypothetical protein AAF937_05885 [Planctomycetota bacterium]